MIPFTLKFGLSFLFRHGDVKIGQNDSDTHKIKNHGILIVSKRLTFCGRGAFLFYAGKKVTGR